MDKIFYALARLEVRKLMASLRADRETVSRCLDALSDEVIDAGVVMTHGPVAVFAASLAPKPDPDGLGPTTPAQACREWFHTDQGKYFTKYLRDMVAH